MRGTCLVAAALTLFALSSAHAQRRVRIGPTYSSVSLEDGSGSSHSFSSFGGSVALITGDEGETGLAIARYNDLSTDKGLRRLSLYVLDSYYYPVGTRGVVAPFALTVLGLARVTEVDSLCLLSIIPCSASASATSELALAFGLGVRANVGGTVAVQIDLAPLRITAGCPPTGCSENAVLFAPTYEASARPAWGRVYGQVGLLLAGVYSQGPDRGIAQGAHGGVGVDLYGGRVMWNLNSRLLWLQRNSGENVFGVQVGVAVSPRIGGAR